MRSWRLARLARMVCLMALGVGCAPPARDAATVVYASGADLESANPLVTVHPLSKQIQRYVLFVTLARYDSLLAPVPWAASSWAWSDDRRSLTFTLVPGLQWHDGVPTTARDVAFTLNAARNPTTGYPRYTDLASVTAVEAVDDSTVTVRFSEPPPGFPLVLCELPILPSHLLGVVAPGEMRRAEFNLAPVGNGPFRFRERDAGSRWVFDRNDDFPLVLGGPPRLERLVVAVVDEATTKFAGLVSGDLDVAGIAPTMVSLVRRDPALRAITYPVLFSTGIIFNTARSPFDDLRVRRAINVALRRERVVAAAFAGLAAPAGGPVSPASPFAIADSISYDAILADSLLDAAAWRRGADGWRRRADEYLTFELLTVGAGDNAVEQLIQGDLAERGIRMEIRQLEMGAFLTAARAERKEFGALIAGVAGDLSLAYLSAMYDSRLAGSALDYGGYHTPRLDSLLNAARSAPPDRAAVAWHGVQRELAAELPAVWIFHSRGVQGVSARLRGVTMDLRGEMVTIAGWHVGGDAGVANSAR